MDDYENVFRSSYPECFWVSRILLFSGYQGDCFHRGFEATGP